METKAERILDFSSRILGFHLLSMYLILPALAVTALYNDDMVCLRKAAQETINVCRLISATGAQCISI